jgi:hypothetical protein
MLAFILLGILGLGFGILFYVNFLSLILSKKKKTLDKKGEIMK